MFLSEPPRSQYDLEFAIFGFHVRVHPFHFLVMGILGLISSKVIYFVPIWIVVAFISILVHELGHTFAMRYYGMGARIVLYAMGGLAIPESHYGGGRRSEYQQIVISAAGPIAGFILAGIVIAAIKLGGGEFVLHFRSVYFWAFDLPGEPRFNASGVPNNAMFLREVVSVALFINILWGVLNLLPIYPLDGGQIARELFIKFDGLNGVRNSLMLSAFTGGALAVWGLTTGSIFMMFMFGSLAFQSWQAAQNMGGGGYGGGYGGGRPW